MRVACVTLIPAASGRLQKFTNQRTEPSVTEWRTALNWN